MDLAGLGSQFLGNRTSLRTEGLCAQLSWSTSLGLPVRKERILGWGGGRVVWTDSQKQRDSQKLLDREDCPLLPTQADLCLWASRTPVDLCG